MSHLHYLPVDLPFFSILIGAVFVLIVVMELRALRYAYLSIGLSSGASMLVLMASLVGSYFNIPVVELAGRQELTGEVIYFYGVGYVVPTKVDWPGTIVAVNVGGALIPGLVSVYLLFKHRIWLRGILAIACVAAITHWLAQPVPGLGIALPTFVPAIATAVTALVLAWSRAAPLAYIAGSIGTLIGADLSNLGAVQGLGAPIASIGGAGTFDGIFLTGVLAVLIAGIPAAFRRKPPAKYDSMRSPSR